MQGTNLKTSFMPIDGVKLIAYNAGTSFTKLTWVFGVSFGNFVL
jgi:hypothetical protein